MKYWILTGIVVLLSLAAAVWLLLFRENTSQVTNADNQTLSPSPFEIPKGWQTYTDELYNYSISYPTGFKIKENGEDSRQILIDLDPEGVGLLTFYMSHQLTKLKKLNRDRFITITRHGLIN